MFLYDPHTFHLLWEIKALFPPDELSIQTSTLPTFWWGEVSMEFSLLISQVLLYINNNPLFEKTGEH